jgi:hypothetical protein
MLPFLISLLSNSDTVKFSFIVTSRIPQNNPEADLKIFRYICVKYKY